AFDGASVQEVLYKQMAEDPPNLRTERSDVPEGVVKVLERALVKDREQRWQHMAEALAALDAQLPAAHLRRVDRTGRVRPEKPLP
ncbi:MAG: hypothetical protein OEW72_10050, partial [Gammaproteobacteria bacterium]|nr:hypothetical protein [Gammaproteobacteria bacterium]